MSCSFSFVGKRLQNLLENTVLWIECMHLCFDFLFFNNSHILVTDRTTVLAKFRCYVHAVNCCVSNYTSMKLGADLLHFFSTLCMNLSRRREWAPTPWWVLDTYSRCLYICWMRQTKGSKTAVALQSDSQGHYLLSIHPLWTEGHDKQLGQIPVESIREFPHYSYVPCVLKHKMDTGI